MKIANQIIKKEGSNVTSECRLTAKKNYSFLKQTKVSSVRNVLDKREEKVNSLNYRVAIVRFCGGQKKSLILVVDEI